MLKKVINNKNKTLKYKFIFVFKELIFFKSKVHIYVCFVNLVKKNTGKYWCSIKLSFGLYI